MNNEPTGTGGAPRSASSNYEQEALSNTVAPKAQRCVDPDFLKRVIQTHVAKEVHGPDDIAKKHNNTGVSTNELFDALLVSDDTFLHTVVPTLMDHGINLDEFYDKVLSAVVGRLGTMWCDDTIDFVAIEMISARMRLLCRELTRKRAMTQPPSDVFERPSVLLARGSGDGHTLGLTIVEAFFREAGWRVSGGAYLTPGEALDSVVSETPYSVVAFSFGLASGDNPEKHIEEVRKRSANSNIKIGIGGLGVVVNSARYAQVGADFIAMDARDAVNKARALITM